MAMAARANGWWLVGTILSVVPNVKEIAPMTSAVECRRIGAATHWVPNDDPSLSCAIPVSCALTSAFCTRDGFVIVFTVSRGIRTDNARLTAGLPEKRLVTLTGPGGVGKTRLAATIAADLTNKQIATRLSVAQRTAEAHIQHILTKLGFTGRAQIAAWAARRNAVSPTPGSINAPEK